MKHYKNLFVLIAVLFFVVFGQGVQGANTDQPPGAIFQTIYHLEASYYAPDSVSYPKLLNIALASVQKELQSQNIVINITPISPDQPNREAWRDFIIFWASYIAQHETSDHWLEFVAIDSMLKSFNNSHTRFFDPEAFAREKDQLTKEGELVLEAKFINVNGRRILHVQLYTFFTHDNCAELLDEEFEKYIPVEGIIIDVRNNPGGVSRNCYDLLEVFLPEGVDLWIEKTPLQTRTITSIQEQVYTQPLVVMINQFSASASEVFSGVFQEQKRAIIVGQQSAGAVSKGAIKILYSYGAAISITIRQIFTAGGTNLEGVGVIPDIKVECTADDIIAGRDPQLEKAIETLIQLIDHKSP